MYYLELIQRFWVFNQRIPIGSTAISMYLYLLKIGYDNERYDFQISDVVISKELCITRKTVKITKENLRNLGLIQFQSKTGLPCYYRLILNYPLHTSEPEKIEKEKIEISPASIESIESSGPSLKASPITILPQDTHEEVEIQSSKTTQLSQPKLTDHDKNIPSWEEFIDYAHSLEKYDPQLDFGIKDKYENWISNGWKNNSDRPITNWKSTLKSTLPYIKNTDVFNQLLIQSIPNIKRPKSIPNE